MSDITLIPTDILRRIIVLSCTDGGYTGRSLSETCRLLYTQSHDIRFYSLSISSLKQLQDFLESIRPKASAGAHHQLRVHHLWLSFRGADDRDVLASSPSNFSWSCVPGATADDEERLRADLARAQALVEQWPSRCAAAIHELLPLVAPTLRTLCVLQGDQQPLPAFFQHLPHLRELTIYNGLAGTHRRRASLGPSALRGDDTLDWANALRMPALERLHFVAHGSTRAVFLRRSPLRNANLTHLRVSNIGQSDTAMGFTDLLAKSLGLPLPGRRPYEQRGGPLPGAPSAIPSDATFPRLRELVLHDVEVRPGDFCGTNAAEYQDVRWCLEEIVATVNLMEGVRALYLSSQEGVFSGCSAERLWDDWLDRIDGGPGCWVESQEEEERLEKVATVREEHEEERQLQELQQLLAIDDGEVILANGCVCEDHLEHSDESHSITSTETSWGCNVV